MLPSEMKPGLVYLVLRYKGTPVGAWGIKPWNVAVVFSFDGKLPQQPVDEVVHVRNRRIIAAKKLSAPGGGPLIVRRGAEGKMPDNLTLNLMG